MPNPISITEPGYYRVAKAGKSGQEPHAADASNYSRSCMSEKRVNQNMDYVNKISARGLDPAGSMAPSDPVSDTMRLGGGVGGHACRCEGSDAWRCAVKQGTTSTIACQCICHRDGQREDWR